MQRHDPLINLKPLDTVIQQALQEFRTEEILTSLPATVVNIDNYESKQTVDITLDIRDILPDGRRLNSVKLPDVFVKLPNGGDFAINLPIKVNDKVTVNFASKSVSEYLAGNGEPISIPVYEESDLMDCWVTHGFGTKNNNQNPSATDIQVIHDKVQVNISPEGFITINAEKDINISCDNAKVTAKTGIILETPETKCTGNLTVDGNIQGNSNLNISGEIFSSGSISSATEVKAPAFSSYGNGGGSIAVKSAVINGIEVDQHRHDDAQGGSTGVMK